MIKLYQVVNSKDHDRIYKTARSQEECEEYLNSSDLSDLMSTVYLTILPIWTNASPSKIDALLKE